MRRINALAYRLPCNDYCWRMFEYMEALCQVAAEEMGSFWATSVCAKRR